MAAVAVVFVMPAGAARATGSMGDIGDHGTWITEHNAAAFTENLNHDMNAFGKFLSAGTSHEYVPVEARVGLAFMGAMSLIGDILESSLVRFMILFIIAAFAFWILFDTYQMMRDGQKAMELVDDIIKKAVLITVWIMVLNVGPAKLFVVLVEPIVAFGTYMADLILNAVTGVAGIRLPDTCGAIHEYVANNAGDGLILNADAAANLMCLPTRLSGFFYAVVQIGWKWMVAGIGTSVVSFVAGGALIGIFVCNIWSIALMGFGVIADLFLAIFMLPFTAVAETVSKTKYKGIAGDMFNGFLGIFKSEKFTTQVTRFINAAIYFVSMAIVIAVTAALLGGIVTIDASGTPTLATDDYLVLLLGGLLVNYLMRNADKTARDIGGKIENTVGKQVGDTIKTLQTNLTKQIASWRKAASGKK